MVFDIERFGMVCFMKVATWCGGGGRCGGCEVDVLGWVGLHGMGWVRVHRFLGSFTWVEC